MGGQGTGDGPGTLPPDEAAGLRTLEARTARIDRELAVSQSWLAGLTRLAETEDAPEGPSPGFTRSFLEETDRERTLILKPLPLDRQAPLEQDLMALRQGFAERAASVEADGMALRRRLALHRTLEGYRTGVAKDPGLYDDAAGRMQALVADLGLPDERRQTLDLHIRDALGNAAVDGLMQEPERAERLLSAGLFDDALTEASKASRLQEAQSFVARNSLLARERTLSKLTAQASQGIGSDEAIATAIEDGILTAAEAEQLRGRKLEAVQVAELRQARIERVASAATLDPGNAEDKAAVDAYWDEVSEVHTSDDAEAQRRAELAFVARIGVLPDALRRKYQGAVLSADPAIAVSGATAIDELNRLNPALATDIPEGQRRRAAAIAQYAALDLPPDQAIALAEVEIEEDEEPASINITDSGTPEEGSGAEIVGSEQSAPDHSAVPAGLPELITEILAEEGLSGDQENAAGLTQITAAALALGLPLDDETAATLLDLSNGSRLPNAETVTPLQVSTGGKRRTGARDLLMRLWQRMTRPKPDDERPPRPPLPGPELLPAPQRKDQPTSSGEEGPLLPQVPFGEDQILQIGDDRIDAQLRGDPKAIRRGIDNEANKPQYRIVESVDADASNKDSIARMRADGRLKPDQEGHPPFRVDVPTHILTVEQDGTEFFRVTSNPSMPEGFWLMPKEAFDKIMRSPSVRQAAKQLLALPGKEPTHYVPVKLPAGTRLRIGAANGKADWGVGNGIQIEILDHLDDDWFGEPVPMTGR
jgi:hypothetical protein